MGLEGNCFFAFPVQDVDIDGLKGRVFGILDDGRSPLLFHFFLSQDVHFVVLKVYLFFFHLVHRNYY